VRRGARSPQISLLMGQTADMIEPPLPGCGALGEHLPSMRPTERTGVALQRLRMCRMPSLRCDVSKRESRPMRATAKAADLDGDELGC
jgi:hypothetical protein